MKVDWWTGAGTGMGVVWVESVVEDVAIFNVLGGVLFLHLSVGEVLIR